MQKQQRICRFDLFGGGLIPEYLKIHAVLLFFRLVFHASKKGNKKSDSITGRTIRTGLKHDIYIIKKKELEVKTMDAQL